MTGQVARDPRGRTDDLAARIGQWAVGFAPDGSRLERVAASEEDFDACVRAGARLPELAPALQLAAAGTVTVPGVARGFNAAGAALVAGTAGALLQLHDLQLDAGIHASSPVIAAVWAACPDTRGGAAPADGGQPTARLRAIAAGYELAHRVSLACSPGQALAGSSATATAGALGAAVAAALAMDLGAAAVARAVRNAALLLPVAPLAAIRAHGELVPLHGGLAARAGVEAALLARHHDAGWRVLEGDAAVPGLVHLLQGEPRRLEPQAWDGAMLDRIAWKFFPACFTAHAALEATLRLPAVDVAQIVRVTIGLSPPARWLVDQGPEQGGLYDRLMSLRWVVARALEQRHYGADVDLGPAPRTAALARRIEIAAAPELDDLPRDTIGANVELALRNARHRLEYRRLAGAPPAGPVGWTLQLDRPRLQAKRAALLARASVR